MDSYATMECLEITTAIRWMEQLAADGGATEAAKLVAIKAYRSASLRLLSEGEALVDALTVEKVEDEQGGQAEPDMRVQRAAIIYCAERS